MEKLSTLNTTVRVTGNQSPAYLNGRPRAMLIEAFGSKGGETSVSVLLHQAGVLQAAA